ncbi:MAG TPA: hypothetical protein VHX86_05965 [Tepidisphaeraceae bacterium]|jgi:hypothetical protein|nr:hypothetical protein [Tepidisphaeraceae bacterium]
MLKVRSVVIGCLLTLAAAGSALAAPTPEDVSRSLNQTLDQPVDMSKAVPYLLSALGFVILAILYHFHSQRKTTPRSLNHPGKLTREISRRIALRSVELKQLKILAQEQQLEHPLTLILCPSALGKAIRTPSPRVDRSVLKQIVQRLKQSLV